jgi:SET domain-containing protein
MKPSLFNCGKLEVRQSPVEGYGVFALEDIEANEILEETPFILFPKYTAWGKEQYDALNGKGILSEREKYIENLRENLGFKLPEKYYFRWQPRVANLPGGEIVSFPVLPLGNGPIYNTSNTNNNATWKVQDNLFIFVAERNIAKGEEIKTFYGYFLDEYGNTFNIDRVFYLGLDAYSDGVKLEKVRFTQTEHLKLIKTNPEYKKLESFIDDAEEKRVGIVRIEADKYAFSFPVGFPLSHFYQKLVEFKSSRFENTKFFLEYIQSGTRQLIKETVVLPNNV